MKKLAFLSVVLIVLLTAPHVLAQNDDAFKIGALIKNTDNPFFARMAEGYEFAAERYGVEIVIGSTASEAELDKQLETLLAWIDEGDFDAFIVTPFRSDNLIEGLAAASEAGIPIINTDEIIPADLLNANNIEIATRIASNNVRAGMLAGSYIVESVPPGASVASVEGAIGTQSSIDRVQGFITAAESAGLRVVASQPANWDYDEAYDVTLDIMDRHPNVRAIFAANDGMALGVVAALEDQGLADTVIVVGVDAIPEALEAVEAGRLAGTVKQFPDEMAYLAIENAIKVIEGRPIPPVIESPVALITRQD